MIRTLSSNAWPASSGQFSKDRPFSPPAPIPGPGLSQVSFGEPRSTSPPVGLLLSKIIAALTPMPWSGSNPSIKIGSPAALWIVVQVSPAGGGALPQRKVPAGSPSQSICSWAPNGVHPNSTINNTKMELDTKRSDCLIRDFLLRFECPQLEQLEVLTYSTAAAAHEIARFLNDFNCGDCVLLPTRQGSRRPRLRQDLGANRLK
jgi:hypothetical protein